VSSVLSRVQQRSRYKAARRETNSVLGWAAPSWSAIGWPCRPLYTKAATCELSYLPLLIRRSTRAPYSTSSSMVFANSSSKSCRCAYEVGSRQRML